MSDYCYMEISFMKEDMEAISRLFGYSGSEFWDELVDDEDKWMKVEIHQANYAFSNARNEAASRGLVFYGYAADGDGYPSCLFVSFGGKHIEVSEVSRWPAARLDDSGNPMPEDLKAGKEYLLFHQLAVKFMEGTLDAKNPGGKPQEGAV